ncbi:hypothetical protein diail_1198 [Diaporthe ilicicola]|nr:hypothetical protein diail_1198 [Diaporthe ilicicola]
MGSFFSFLAESEGSDDDGDEDTLLAQSTKDRRDHVRKIWYRSVSIYFKRFDSGGFTGSFPKVLVLGTETQEVLASLLGLPSNVQLETLTDPASPRDIWGWKFWTVAKQDPEEIWINLCQTRKAVRATKLCEAFLHTYATRTRKRRRSLVNEFDQTLLARKRREDPDNMEKWSLKFKDGFLKGKGQGPIAEVARCIAAHAEDMGLTREQTFVKKEATAEDIALVLRTLWTRAEDIPCDPVTRVSFHNTLLLGAIGGFRPGVLENLKYRQNKQRASAIRRDQSNVLEFTITLVPQKIFCPVSLVVARALADDAFYPSFDSVHSLLSRPNLEHTKCVPLKWKDDALDREIFPLTYNRFGELWRRTILVAGYPERIRPYSIRVGAGSVFTHALRNYILSHTSVVFGRSYQARHIRENLMAALTPEADRDEELFQLLRHIPDQGRYKSVGADPNRLAQLAREQRQSQVQQAAANHQPIVTAPGR